MSFRSSFFSLIAITIILYLIILLHVTKPSISLMTQRLLCLVKMLRNNHFCWLLSYQLLLFILILTGIEAVEVDRKEVFFYYTKLVLYIFIILFLLVLICIVLQDFYIVFLKDNPANEESVFQRHIDVLSSLKGRLVKLVCHSLM